MIFIGYIEKPISKSYIAAWILYLKVLSIWQNSELNRIAEILNSYISPKKTQTSRKSHRYKRSIQIFLAYLFYETSSII